MKKSRNHSLKLTTLGACLGAMVAGTAVSHAQSAPQAPQRLEKLEQENQDLRKRLESLEMMAQKGGLLEHADATPTALKALSESTISGFVTASYFYDLSNPPGPVSPGYLWNRVPNTFSLNKIKITMASAPVERSGDQFSAGYRFSLMFGQDVPIVNSSAATLGFEAVREAYVEMNIPIGTGLNVKAGELISLLNYESGDGGAANDNFSQGYQWFFTGNGPSAGVRLGYTLSDMFDIKLQIQNGLYAGPIDNNDSKTAILALGIKPNDKSWISLLGFVGREDAFTTHVAGGSLLAGWSVTDKFHVGTELDYFNFRSGGVDAMVYSAGAWLSYAVSETIMPALRVEFLSDTDGVDASGGGLGFANPVGVGQDITSVAFTLNIKPAPNIKIQPEVRYDHTTFATGFGRKADRVTIGAGISYLF
jgi:hypothetical protein